MNIKLIKQVTLVVAIGIASGNSLKANAPLGESRSHALQMEQANQEAYIEQHSFYAIHQFVRYGIPASVTLGQGLLESQSGLSTLAVESNNHFGIKCKNNWSGSKTYHDSQEEDENGFVTTETSCFRVYNSVAESYEDHSVFLKSRPAYEQLVSEKIYDYKVWAHTLQTAGYATDKAYPNKLIKIIERYNLVRFDKRGLEQIKVNSNQPLAQNDPLLLNKVKAEAQSRLLKLQQDYENCKVYNTEVVVQLQADLLAAKSRIKELEVQLKRLAPSKDPFGNDFNPSEEVLSTKEAPNTLDIYPSLGLDYNLTALVNGSRVTVVQTGQDMAAISADFGIDKDLLYKYNDMSVGTALIEGQYIFLEAKQPKIRTDQAAHEVMVGETVHSISQRYGIQTNVLRKRNRLKAGEEPQVNQQMYLKGKNPKKPKLQSTNYHTPQSNW